MCVCVCATYVYIVSDMKMVRDLEVNSGCFDGV